MTLQVINVGSVANDGTGDVWRTAWIKTNTNFDQLFNGPMVMGPPAASGINLTIDQGAYESDTVPGILIKGNTGFSAFLCLAADGATPIGVGGSTFDMQQSSSGNGFITLRKVGSVLNISTASVLRIQVGATGTTTFINPSSDVTTVVINNSSATHGAILISSTVAQRIATFNNSSGTGGYIAYEHSGSDKSFWGDSGVLATGGTTDDTCFRANNSMDLATGGATRRVTISSAGNATVRTPDSGINLVVDQGTLDTGTVPGIQTKGNAGFGSRISICGNGASPSINSFDLIQVAAGDCYIINRSNNNMVFWTNNTPTMLLSNAQQAFFYGNVGVNGNTPPVQVTGWGTPTGPAVINNFSGAAATLVNCSNAIAKIITDLKAFGLYGA